MLFPLHLCIHGYLCILLHSSINLDQEALETPMKLESSLVGENDAWIAQVQSQLATITIQLHKLQKEKKNVRNFGVPHLEKNVTIRMNVQCFSSI